MSASTSMATEVQRLCMQYKTDTLREAIEACEEELEWLRDLADRFEPIEDPPAEGSQFDSLAELEADRDAICRSVGIGRWA